MPVEPLPDPPRRGVRKEEPRKRRTLNRDAIVDVALAIVDKDGLDGLSMRRVAERLDTGPASLYAHVSNKDDLMELVYDRVVGELELPEPDPEHWQEQIKEALSELYHVLIAHRDIARVSLARVPSGPNMLRLAEGMLAILRSGGVPDRVAGLAMDYTALVINARAYEEGLFPPDFTPEQIQQYYSEVTDYFSALPADRFPNLVAMVGPLTEPDGDERLEFTLDAVVQGIAALADSAKRRR